MQKENSFHPVIFATSDVIQKLATSFTTIAATNFIAMHEDPIEAVQTKKDSSLCLGLTALATGEIDAFVSAGHTGALLVGSKTILKTLPGIDRPALLAALPTKKHEVAVLDVGANTSLQAKHLIQLAAMGLAYQKTRGIENPKIALLNIGKEPSKGTTQLQEAYHRLLTLKNGVFVGNIEGRDVFEGDIQVLVTDGFAGNIFLKTAEGVASFILSHLENELSSEMIGKLRTRLHYTEYPGAILCGINGIVIKCHGDGNPIAFINGIKGAIRLVQHQFINSLKESLYKGL
ncbi:MAG: phosphate acyltransferase PlsX [Rhabdochlamydiaceae bacterium]